MKREAKVGILFFAGLGLLLWFALFVTGFSARGGDYEVRFDSVTGLRIGDAVTFNGVRIGKISDVVPVRNGDGGSEVAVFFDIDRRMRDAVVVSEDAVFAIQMGLLGGGSLAISSRGPGEVLQPGLVNTHRGGAPVDLGTVLTQVSELIDDNRANLRAAIADLPRAVKNMGDMGGEIQEVVAENRRTINEAISGMRDMTTSIRTVVDENRKDIQAAIQRMASLMEELKGMVEENRPDVRTAISRAPQMMEEFTTVGREVRTMVQENRKRIDEIIAGFANFAPRLDRIGADIETVTAQIASGQGSVGKAIFEDDLFDNANEAMDSLRRRADELETFTSSFATTRLYGGIEGGYNYRTEVAHGLAYLRLEPKPWKYYQVGIGYRSDPKWINDEPEFTADFTPDDLKDREERYRDGLRALDLHLAIGYRFFPDDDIERYRLDLAAGLFDGRLGGRVGFHFTENLSLWTMARMSDDSRLPNREKRERGSAFGRATLSYEPWRGVRLQAGVDDLFYRPGPYGAITLEVMDRDLVNLFVAAGSL
ncbi:MAG: MCE family protein [Planctomycetota bacterium]|nr:MAG: MCE family protein [Planctomycetota bacterium]